MAKKITSAKTTPTKKPMTPKGAKVITKKTVE